MHDDGSSIEGANKNSSLMVSWRRAFAIPTATAFITWWSRNVWCEMPSSQNSLVYQGVDRCGQIGAWVIGKNFSCSMGQNPRGVSHTVCSTRHPECWFAGPAIPEFGKLKAFANVWLETTVTGATLAAGVWTLSSDTIVDATEATVVRFGMVVANVDLVTSSLWTTALVSLAVCQSSSSTLLCPVNSA